jgi:hypothetical protein
VGYTGGGGPQVAYLGSQPHHGNIRNESFDHNGQNFTEFGSINYANLSTLLQQSQFQVAQDISNPPNPIHPPVLTPNVQNGAAVWFDYKANPPGGTFACPTELSDCPTPGEPGGISTEITEGDVLIVNGTFTGANFPGAQLWKAKRHLYRRLADNPELIESGTVIDTFYQTETSTTVGRFDAVRVAMEEMFVLDSEMHNQLAAGVDSLHLQLDTLKSVMEQLLNPPSQQDSLYLLAKKAAATQTLRLLSASLQQLEDSIIVRQA